MAKVLAVDDEAQILTAVARGLGRFGHTVIVARNALDGLATAAAASPDVVLLDRRLPDLDGLEVIRRLRAWSQVPILLLSGDRSERTCVAALDAGADDVLPKPFSMEELRARVAVRVRRGVQGEERSARKEPHLRCGDLAVDLVGRQITLRGTAVRLTPTQWRLLETLVAHPGKLLTYGGIIVAVWSDQHGDEARGALRVHMSSLRRKLGDDASAPCYIETEPGVGYRWIGDVAP